MSFVAHSAKMEGSHGHVQATSRLKSVGREFYSLRPGDRVPSVRELAGRHGCSSGAVQAVINDLRRLGALELDRTPRRSVVDSVSMGPLWAATEQTPLVLSLPLPANLRAQGLATGLRQRLRDAEFDSYMTFARGSRNRLRVLRDGSCRIAVMSHFAATELTSDGERLFTLPPGTFALERRVFEVESVSTRRELRVAVDADSADLQRLTEIEFEGQSIVRVPAVYLQFLRLLIEREVDAAVWDLDESTQVLPQGIISRPLSERVRRSVGDADTSATFVVKTDDLPAQEIVRTILMHEETLRVQQEVIDHKRAPDF